MVSFSIYHFPELATLLGQRVKVSPTGCWEWRGAKTSQGYGSAPASIATKYGTVLAHRLSYLVTTGAFPPWPNIVRHKCDNPICIRPDHLIEGTRADNMKDRDERGRTPKGEKHFNAKLTEQAVIEIRSSRASSAKLAVRYGVSKLTIHNARHSRTWKHIPPAKHATA